MQQLKKSLTICSLFLCMIPLFVLAYATFPTELVAVGQTVGIEVHCDGVMVIALEEKETHLPGVQAGFLPGDIITQVAGEKVSSLSQFQNILSNAKEEFISVGIYRGGKPMQLRLSTIKDENDKIELGLWLRDSIAGIGTLTFYDPLSGIFGALGHGVSDAESGNLMPMGEGYILPSTVKSVRPGKAGAPGELQGNFEFTRRIGRLLKNTHTGIYGQLEDTTAFLPGETLPVGRAADVHVGPAKIRSNVRGSQVDEFDIEISRVFSGGEDRNLLITVTDPQLISITGGIVQGMSGSPIIQNGKIVGAVTHVLINNPEKGYGILIESMLEDAYAGPNAA